MSIISDNTDLPYRILQDAAPGKFVLVCEHASNHIPPGLGSLGLTEMQLQAHIAWDPGAAALTLALAERLEATAILGTLSRLIYDLNRAPDAANAITLKSEMHDIPGNADLTAAQRAERVTDVYLPFHAALSRIIALRLAAGQPTVLVTVHSFTPHWFGTPRAVEIGVLHDADPRLAVALLPRIRAAGCFVTEMNAPYSAADHVTHTLRLHALPYGLMNVMLEIRNDLLASTTQFGAIADLLAQSLREAVAQGREVA